MWKPRKRAHKLFVFDDSRTDYRTKCFCTQKINLVKCGGNGSSHTKNHISLIALQCSIQIAMLTPRPFTILCVPITHTLQMHFHARHWLQKLHIWAQLDAWRITERGIWVVLASSTRSSRLGPPSQTITKIGPFVNSFCTSSNKNQQKMYQKQMSQIIQTIQWHIVVSMKFIRLFLWHVSSEVLFSAASFRWISF